MLGIEPARPPTTSPRATLVAEVRRRGTSPATRAALLPQLAVPSATTAERSLTTISGRHGRSGRRAPARDQRPRFRCGESRPGPASICEAAVADVPREPARQEAARWSSGLMDVGVEEDIGADGLGRRCCSSTGRRALRACCPSPAIVGATKTQQPVDQVALEEGGGQRRPALEQQRLDAFAAQAPRARPRAARTSSSSSEPFGQRAAAEGDPARLARRGRRRARRAAGRPRGRCPCPRRPRRRPRAARARGAGSPRRSPSASRARSRGRRA